MGAVAPMEGPAKGCSRAWAPSKPIPRGSALAAGEGSARRPVGCVSWQSQCSSADIVCQDSFGGARSGPVRPPWGP